MPDVQLIPEEPVLGKRLGWHRHHKDSNRAYPVSELLQTTAVTDRSWNTCRVPLDQGQLGSCTGNACIRMVAETPHHPVKTYNETAAVSLYKLATRVDNLYGSYPPDDTGSTTVGVLTAAQQKGLVTAYRWAFSFDEAIATLSQIGPVITGLDWYTGFDYPTAEGFCEISGYIRGGHELCVDTLVQGANWAGGGYVEGWNSWGRWGPINGRFRFSFSTWQQLLNQGGEVGVGTDQ